MPLPPEFVRYKEGNSWQVLTGAAKRLNDYSLEERLPVTTANELVRLTLLPTIAEIHPSKRGIHFINRLKYVVGQWQRVHKPEERENSLMWELASYPYVDPKVESNIITLLAHTSLVEELFANLWVLCPIEHTGQGFDIEAWRDHFLVPMQRLAAAVHERVAYALVPNFHEEDTVAIARKYPLEQKNVSTLLASLLTTEPEAAKPEVILAGPEVAEIKGHIASTALLLTEAGSETSKDYDPEILIWSLALPESDLSARAALELGHRLDCHELDHKDIYSRLGLLPLDIYHYHLWRHLNSNVIYSISQPEYLGELYRFLRAKSNSQDAVALGHYGHTVSSLIQGIELVESLIEQRIAQIEAEAVPQELTKKMQQALREKGKAEESMTHLLCRLYWVEGMSRGEIARQLGVTLMTIVNWMDQLKIPGKNRLAASRAVISLDDYHQRITREHEEKIMARLVDKFGQNPLEEIRSRLNKRATLQELAKEVGIVAETFSRWLRQLGFEKPNLPKRSGRIDSYRQTYTQAFAEGILEKIASQEVIQALQLYFNQERSIPEIATELGIERYSDVLRQRMLSALRRAAKLLESRKL